MAVSLKVSSQIQQITIEDDGEPLAMDGDDTCIAVQMSLGHCVVRWLSQEKPCRLDDPDLIPRTWITLEGQR